MIYLAVGNWLEGCGFIKSKVGRYIRSKVGKNWVVVWLDQDAVRLWPMRTSTIKFVIVRYGDPDLFVKLEEFLND